MANVLDVAQYILETEGRALSTMKLQKLTYYSQAWNLVWEEVRLYGSAIEAWANGPVVRDLYEVHRGRFSVDPSDELGDATQLTNAEKETVDAVLRAYGHLSGQQLCDLSQNERPWLEARRGTPTGAPSDRAINPEVMQEFFGSQFSAMASAV